MQTEASSPSLHMPLTELELHLAKLLFLNEAAKSLGHDVAGVNVNSRPYVNSLTMLNWVLLVKRIEGYIFGWCSTCYPLR